MATPGLQNTSWDSPKSALQFIVGIFLFFGLLGFVYDGVKDFYFIATNPSQKSVEVQGYAGQIVEHIYADPYSSSNATWYYYPLYSSPTGTVPQMFVKHHEVLVYFSNTNIRELPSLGHMVTVQGVSGQEKLPGDVLKKYGDYGEVPVVVSQAKVPTVSRILPWFLPAFAAWVGGVLLIVRWGIQLRKYFKRKN